MQTFSQTGQEKKIEKINKIRNESEELTSNPAEIRILRMYTKKLSNVDNNGKKNMLKSRKRFINKLDNVDEVENTQKYKNVQN